MDREKSALLAAWLSFGANILTLCVAIFGLVVGAIALLSINRATCKTPEVRGAVGVFGLG